jgi:hypothetical protein
MTPTIQSARVPVIVETEAAFTESLFAPGGTADGYVVRRGKRFVDVFLAGREYRVNQWLVWCMRSAPGQPWQHAVLDLPFTVLAADEAARKLSTGCAWVGRDLVRQFDSPTP